MQAGERRVLGLQSTPFGVLHRPEAASMGVATPARPQSELTIVHFTAATKLIASRRLPQLPSGPPVMFGTFFGSNRPIAFDSVQQNERGDENYSLNGTVVDCCENSAGKSRAIFPCRVAHQPHEPSFGAGTTEIVPRAGSLYAPLPVLHRQSAHLRSPPPVRAPRLR